MSFFDKMLALHPGGGQMNNGSNVVLWGYINHIYHQWMIQDTGKGWCKVYAKQNDLCMNNSSEGTSNGKTISSDKADNVKIKLRRKTGKRFL